MDSDEDIRRALVALSQGTSAPSERSMPLRTSFKFTAGPPPVSSATTSSGSISGGGSGVHHGTGQDELKQIPHNHQHHRSSFSKGGYSHYHPHHRDNNNNGSNNHVTSYTTIGSTSGSSATHPLTASTPCAQEREDVMVISSSSCSSPGSVQACSAPPPCLPPSVPQVPLQKQKQPQPQRDKEVAVNRKEVVIAPNVGSSQPPPSSFASTTITTTTTAVAAKSVNTSALPLGRITPEEAVELLPLGIASWVSQQDRERFAINLAVMDASQREAVCFDTECPLLVLAGAGSGKTQTMAMRIAYLLMRGVAAKNILGICFTRQAAETLRARVESVLPLTMRSHCTALKLRTLHALGLECLRRFGIVGPETEVFDASRQRELAKRIVQEHAVHLKSSEAVENLVEYVNRVKGKKEPPLVEVNPQMQEAYLYRFYQKELHDVCNAVDFGDLQHMLCGVLRPVKAVERTDGSDSRQADGGEEQEGEEMPLLASQQPSASSSQSRPPQQPLPPVPLAPSTTCAALRNAFTHIVVDEFQDLNEVQMEIIALLAGDACRVTCVGDPNQCIYAWRGAMPAIFTAWKRRFPQSQMRALAINYRSDRDIVVAANRIVGAEQHPCHERHQRRVTLLTCEALEQEKEAAPLVIEELLRGRDAQMVYGDIAVLCRTRRRVSEYYELLKARRIPVRQLKGVAPDNISTVRALLAMLRLCVSPHSDTDVRTALTCGPSHLSSRVAKGFFFSLSATCEERRVAQQAPVRAWRQEQQSHHLHREDFNGDDDKYRGCRRRHSPVLSKVALHAEGLSAELAIRPMEYSFFSIIRELVFNNFSADVFPKLANVPKTGQKVLRGFVQVLARAHEMLSQPTCDVEHLLRFVVAELGYDTATNADVQLVEGSGGSRHGGRRSAGGVGKKRARGSSSGAGRSIAEAVAAEFSSSACAGGERDAEGELRNTAVAAMMECGAQNHRNMREKVMAGSDGDASSFYTLEEEEDILKTVRFSLTELLLQAYWRVMDDMAAEEEAGAIRKDSHDGNSAGSGGGRSARTPALELRRVLDQFLSILPSDDFGSLALAVSDAAAEGSPAKPKTRPVGQVTLGTVHKAKGMEWPAVIIPGCWVGEFPIVRWNEEEKRVFYVAMSRAMTDLVLITAKQGQAKQDLMQEHAAGPTLERTPYLSMIEEELEKLDFAQLKKAVNGF